MNWVVQVVDHEGDSAYFGTTSGDVIKVDDDAGDGCYPVDDGCYPDYDGCYPDYDDDNILLLRLLWTANPVAPLPL